MSGKKFQLELTGRPLDGYRTEEVAEALARLLRLPGKQARNLLRGTPSRIKRELEKEKAVHLMGKIIACGAQCEINPSEDPVQEEVPESIEASAGLSDTLQLELDAAPLDMELESMPAEEETQLISDGLEAETESAVHAVHPEAARAAEERADIPSAPVAGGRLRLLAFAAAAAVLLGLVVWGGLGFLGGSAPEPQREVAQQPSIEEAAPEVDTEEKKTRQRLELLTRSVRIWMIQYGAGFDPSQVTMERMQQDLEISAEEMEDGWGTRFYYTATAESYTLTSAGPDRILGSEDDISAQRSAR